MIMDCFRTECRKEKLQIAYKQGRANHATLQMEEIFLGIQVIFSWKANFQIFQHFLTKWRQYQPF